MIFPVQGFLGDSVFCGVCLSVLQLYPLMSLCNNSNCCMAAQQLYKVGDVFCDVWLPLLLHAIQRSVTSDTHFLSFAPSEGDHSF